MLGERDVDHMLSQLSASQFSEWQQYFEIETPITAQIFDRHMSQLISMYYNNNRSSNAQSLSPADFRLFDRHKVIEQTPEEMYQMMKGIQSVQQNS
ncbi:phage tail assembly protein T [Rheinheimera sp. 1928-s]|uniref:phage tail assembly protein T n=1 Tax=Rheinheimera sp. 1928-s TaxID=3033803 RepID=UPI00262C03B3|nr:phage tail assembly protein T [Rheinheimera sp. 1928-s]MDF3127395.1 phage tail assembly protein T [Rheinheimera sp. 1928-s]